MATDINQISCGNHVPMCTNIESMCYTPETNLTSNVNYTLIKKKCCEVLRNQAWPLQGPRAPWKPLTCRREDTHGVV